MKVEFYKHNLNEQDFASVIEALKQPILTTGQKVAEFESKFSEYTGCKYTVGVTSCTAALHLSLLAHGIGQGDEVITTPMTFIATATSIIQAGASPIFVDVEKTTGNIDAKLIENYITAKTKAIIPVHLYGTMCDMREIRKIADKYHLIIIEDVAHAPEASRDSVKPGGLGDMACYSFFATKSITAGESGAVCTNNKEIADKVRIMRSHGMTAGSNERFQKRYKHWDMTEFGWKYNMDNIQAALLINQVDRLYENWERREQISRFYEQELKGIVDYPATIGVSGRHLFTIWVENRDEMIGKLQDVGIGITVNYRAIHLLTYFKNRYGFKKSTFPVAEWIGNHTLSLPLYPKLTDAEVEYVIKAVKDAIH